MKVWHLGIESLPERYSAQWNEWFPKAFEAAGLDVIDIVASPLTKGIERGAFLDVVGTNHYKAQQLQALLTFIQQGVVQDDDVVFCADLWFPGIEMLAYVRDGLGMKFRIGGILHAGTWDKYDFLSQKGMGRWANHQERAWLELADFVIVATEFHKELILKMRGFPFESKIHVTGLPFVREELDKYKAPKENIVVFPHRLDPEKQPELFDQLKADFAEKDWQFIRTKDVCKTKEDYYRLLGRAKVAVSFAQQETFGYAMAEASILGCFPVVPDRLSYKEMYPTEFKYATYDGCVARVEKFMSERYTSAWYPTCVDTALGKMANIIAGRTVCRQ